MQWGPDLSPTDEMELEGEDDTEKVNSSGVASGDKSLGESRVEQPSSHENKTVGWTDKTASLAKGLRYLGLVFASCVGGLRSVGLVLEKGRCSK